MDFTPYLDTFQSSSLGEALLSVSVDGKIALAMKGRFFLRCFCENFENQNLIGCAVTDAESCLHYLKVVSTTFCFVQVLHQPTVQHDKLSATTMF